MPRVVLLVSVVKETVAFMKMGVEHSLLRTLTKNFISTFVMKGEVKCLGG